MDIPKNAHFAYFCVQKAPTGQTKPHIQSAGLLSLRLYAHIRRNLA